MLKKIYGSAVFGVEAHTITIEVNVDKGIGYHLVGLPDNAIKESNFRIAAALQNNGYKIPGKKLIINMSPADMRKEGSAYDLPLAMGILAVGTVKGVASTFPPLPIKSKRCTSNATSSWESSPWMERFNPLSAHCPLLLRP